MKVSKIQIITVAATKKRSHLHVCGDSWNFTCSSKTAHRACKMVAFLNRKTLDFMSPCYLVLTG